MKNWGKGKSVLESEIFIEKYILIDSIVDYGRILKVDGQKLNCCIAWAKYHAAEKLNRIMQSNRDVLAWYDGFKTFTSSWYLKGNMQ